MRLTILGCSGSVPGPDAAASGYLLEAEGFLLGIELGNGSLARLQAVRDPFDLDALLLSHLHPDHCADFSALTVMRRYHPDPPYDRRPRRLPVHAPKEAPRRLANAFAADESERAFADLSDVFDFTALHDGELRIGPFAVRTAPVVHPTEAFGIRIEHGGRSLVYSGDTAVCDGIDEVARGADLLLLEASWTDAPDRPEGIHLSGRQAGEIAARAGAGRLVLTHIPPWTERSEVLAEARSAFQGPIELAEQDAVHLV